MRVHRLAKTTHCSEKSRTWNRAFEEKIMSKNKSDCIFFKPNVVKYFYQLQRSLRFGFGVILSASKNSNIPSKFVKSCNRFNNLVGMKTTRASVKR